MSEEPTRTPIPGEQMYRVLLKRARKRREQKAAQEREADQAASTDDRPAR